MWGEDASRISSRRVAATRSSGTVRGTGQGMNQVLDTTKIADLHELDARLPREIRGQSGVLPRILSSLRRGELGLTKPGRPRGSFLLLGPTGVGKTETVVVATTQ